MKRVTGLVALILFAFSWVQVLGDSWDTVVFRDDFDVSVAGMPDPNNWVANYPDFWWWVQGRTFFPSPAYHPGGPFPQVSNGTCVIEHHLYNPWDLGTPKTTFLGGEIHTIRKFVPGTSYRFEANVRCNPYPNGLVTSFFLYGYDGSKSDEIDFEFVSNKTNDDVNYPSGDPVLANTWDESQQKPIYVGIPGLDLTKWNTFRIYWDPNQHRVDWTWIGPNNGEIWLRTETDSFYIPDEPMALYFNFWAPTKDWLDAYNENLQPVSDPAMNRINIYEVNYVEVRTEGPACGDANHLFPIADLNFDCYVNLSDLSIFVDNWLNTPCLAPDACGGADIVNNNVVDFVDFTLLANQWLECTAPK